MVPDLPPLRAASISVGADHTCALVDGAAKCWGANNGGQLGDGSTDDAIIPIQVTGLTSGVTVIDAGESHTCAVHQGAAKCWGYDGERQLGRLSSEPLTVEPAEVEGLSSGVTAISAGAVYTCAIHDGGAKCWGAASLMSLLGEVTILSSASPVEITGMTSGVTDISVGFAHACAVHDGAARCWGLHLSGQLGDRSRELRTTPAQVVGLTSGVTAISAGYYHTCAIHDGAAKCWGNNEAGQLGDDSSRDAIIPVQVKGLTSGVTAISADADHTCAIHNGVTKCWGSNAAGQLGREPDVLRSDEPVDVTGLTSGVTTISAGYYHTCAIHNGVAKCWGNNEAGALGDGTKTSRNLPGPVASP